MKEGALDDKMKKEYTESLRKELLDFYDVVMRDFIADSELRSGIQISGHCRLVLYK